MPVVWVKPNGHVMPERFVESVVSDEQREGEAVADTIMRLALANAAKDPLKADATPTLVRTASMPPSRRFRNAWRLAGDAVVEDMGLARGIHLDRIRQERNARLAASDGPMTRALERGTNVAEWRAYRDALRNVPQVVQAALDAAPTPDALEQVAPVWPEAPAEAKS